MNVRTLRVSTITLTATIAFSVITLLAFIPVSAGQPSSAATTTGSNATFDQNSGLYSPGSKPYNLTYTEWGAKWEQWIYSVPQDTNPLTDKTGKHCDYLQSGPVWFLAGSSGLTVTKSCTIPEGKAILFSVINKVDIKTSASDTQADLRASVKNSVDHVNTLEASVDGVPIQNIPNYRVDSFFNVTLPQNNLIGSAPGDTYGAFDGYWIVLNPLPAGNHTIFARAAAVDVTNPENNVVITRTWHLDIVPHFQPSVTPEFPSSIGSIAIVLALLGTIILAGRITRGNFFRCQ